ncbi:hypothetical protein RQP46_004493 [Phenoliferia psychrophenolica]
MSCGFFFAVQGASSWLTPRVFPERYRKLSRRSQVDWGLHMTGWVHALVVTPLCLYLIRHPSPALVLDPIFGHAPLEERIFAISGGYFLYDLIVSAVLLPTHGVPFLIHASSCCFIFFKAFTPFLNGMAANFLVVHKLGMTGSTLQLVNGVCLLATFFGARICYGGYMTTRLWSLLDDPRITPSLRWGFRTANLALCGLNVSWFRLMVLSIKKRFDVGAAQSEIEDDDKDGKAE